MKKVFLKVIINSFLGLVLILIWSRFVDFKALVANLTAANFQAVVPLFFFFFLVSGCLRALRLRLMLKEYRFSFKDILLVNFLSQFLSFLIPVRAGEVAKSVYFSTQFDLPFGKTVVWVFIDRFLDFLIILLAIALILLLDPTGLPGQIVQTVFIMTAIFALFFIAAVKSEIFMVRAVNFLSKLLVLKSLKSKFLSLSVTIIAGFAVLRRHPAELFLLIVISFAATLSDTLLWFFAFRSLGVDLSFAKTLLGNCLAALTFLIPSAPGYVGSAEAASLAVFSGFLKVDTNIVSSVSVLYHGLTLVALLIVGISALYILKFDLKLVWKKIRSS